MSGRGDGIRTVHRNFDERGGVATRLAALPRPASEPEQPATNHPLGRAVRPSRQLPEGAGVMTKRRWLRMEPTHVAFLLFILLMVVT